MKFIPLILAAAFAGGQAASAATLVLSVTENSTIRSTVGNQGASTELQVGDTTTAGDYIRSALAFDLSHPLLSGATINSATLTFTVVTVDPSSQNTTITLDLYQLTSSFTTTGVTWTSRDGTNNWSTAGGDFGGVLASTTGNPRSTAVGSTIHFSGTTLANTVEDAIGGNIYLLAKSATENNTNRNLFRFASTRNATVDYHPVLTLDYTAAPVPEPATAFLGSLGLLFFLRRRRH